MIFADTLYSEWTNAFVPAFLLIKVSLAQTILGAIAGSLLTMTTITFSTIMVVLTTYSSQFSPRTLPNFITNRVTMRVLGVFMGGFVYSIFALLFMRQKYGHDVISATIGVLVAFICLSFFAYFIHHVATSIQVSNLVEEIAEDAASTIGDGPIADANTEMMQDKPDLGPSGLTGKALESADSGYLQYIDYSRLLAMAVHCDGLIEIHQPLGAFVTPSVPLLTLYRRKDEGKPNPISCLQIGKERTMLQDVEFSMQKIVEITLRAISPGINDPNTAIACILRLGTLLSQVCKQCGDARYMVIRDRNQRIRLVVRHHGASDLLYAAFHQICHYGRGDISILMAILDALAIIAEAGTDAVKRAVSSFISYIEKAFEDVALQAQDLQRVEERRHRLLQAVSG